jgi:hypothetical protein
VVSAGLLWQGEEGPEGQEGVYLSDAASTRLVAPDADLYGVAVEDGWVVVAEPDVPEAGRLGGPLAPVAALRRCPPIQDTRDFTEDRPVETLADGAVYAVVHGTCLRRPRHAEFVVQVHLGTGRLHVVGEVPSGAISLAAAGSRLALTYNAGRENRVRVDVVDSRNARPMYRLLTPPDEGGASYGETTIDAAGDVLVAGEPRPVRGPFEIPVRQAWWGTSRTRVAHTLKVQFGASLSDGHIAYVPRGGERIDVLSLSTGAARTLVSFSGSASLEGFGLGGNVLAWSQQNYAYRLSKQPDACVGYFVVGPTELTEVPLSASGPPVTVSANPGTPPAGPECPVPK